MTDALNGVTVYVKDDTWEYYEMYQSGTKMHLNSGDSLFVEESISEINAMMSNLYHFIINHSAKKS